MEKYTRIENEVLEKLTQMNLSGSAMACALVLLRKTNGFNKTQDGISLSQFVKYIDRSRPTVCKALKELQLVKICLLVEKGNSGNSFSIYSFNKNVEEWQLVKKPKLVKKKKSTSKENETELVKKSLHTKESITKEIIQKKSKEEKTPEYGDKELNKIQGWLRENYPKTLTDLQDRNNLNNFRKVLTSRKDKDEWMYKDPLDNLKIFYSDYDRFRPDQYKMGSVYKLRELVKEWRECGGKFKDEGQEEARRVAYMRQQQTEHEQRKREGVEYYKSNQGFGSKLANKFSLQ